MREAWRRKSNLRSKGLSEAEKIEVLTEYSNKVLKYIQALNCEKAEKEKKNEEEKYKTRREKERAMREKERIKEGEGSALTNHA